ETILLMAVQDVVTELVRDREALAAFRWSGTVVEDQPLRPRLVGRQKAVETVQILPPDLVDRRVGETLARVLQGELIDLDRKPVRLENRAEHGRVAFGLGHGLLLLCHSSSHASRILRFFFLSGSDMLLYFRKKASSSTSSSGVVTNSVSRTSVVTSSAAAIFPIFSADGFGSSLFSSSQM